MARAAHRRPRARWRRALASLVTGACVVAFAVTVGVSPQPPSQPAAGPDQGPAVRRAGVTASVATLSGTAGRWERALQQLDRRRARAFERGDPRMLATVYERGSAVLAADRAVLAAYAARGLTVEGAAFRLLDVSGRRLARGHVVLRVLDRLGPVAARTASGAGIPLPRDRPSVHRLVLTRGADGWRIAAVAALSG